MKIKQNLAIQTKDAQLFFEIKAGKYLLFDSAMFKITILYNQAKKQNVYGYVKLFEIFRKLEAQITYIDEKIKQAKKIIEQTGDIRKAHRILPLGEYNRFKKRLSRFKQKYRL